MRILTVALCCATALEHRNFSPVSQADPSGTHAGGMREEEHMDAPVLESFTQTNVEGGTGLPNKEVRESFTQTNVEGGTGLPNKEVYFDESGEMPQGVTTDRFHFNRLLDHSRIDDLQAQLSQFDVEHARDNIGTMTKRGIQNHFDRTTQQTGAKKMSQEFLAERHRNFRRKMLVLKPPADIPDEAAALAHIDEAVSTQMPQLKSRRTKTLVIFDNTGRYSKITDSFQRQLDHLGIEYVSMCAGTDCKATKQTVTSAGLYEDDSGGDYDSPGMLKVMVARPVHMLYFMNLGYDVLHTDTDMYYRKDVSHELRTFSDRYGFDVLVGNDMCGKVGKSAFDVDNASNFNRNHCNYFCACFVFARSGEVGKKFVSKWYNILREDWKTKHHGKVINDQGALQGLVRETGDRVGVLPPSVVLSGCRVMKLDKSLLANVSVLHANWVIGTAAKIHFLRKYAPAGYLIE